MLSVIEAMVLLLTVCVSPVEEPTRMPRKPTVVPVPPLLMVIEPMLLLETLIVSTKLKSRMPWTGDELAVVEVALTTMVEDPSRLPMVFPVMLAGASNDDVPVWIPMNVG